MDHCRWGVNMPITKNICGRKFKFTDYGENGVVHESGIYEYRGYRIAKEWFDQGWNDRWGVYHETTVRRWVILGHTPYCQFSFTSIAKAADAIDNKIRTGSF